MRLYSIYEIEKLTGGRLTKYRLLRAIGDGSLSAVDSGVSRRGRGAPRFLIAEDAFQAYLEAMKKHSRRAGALSNEEINDILLHISPKKPLLKDTGGSDVVLTTLIQRLHALEEKNAAMEPLVHQGLSWVTEEARRASRRQTLLDALSETEWYEFEKRKGLLEQLGTLK